MPGPKLVGLQSIQRNHNFDLVVLCGKVDGGRSSQPRNLKARGLLVAVETLFPLLVSTLPEPRREDRASSFKSA